MNLGDDTTSFYLKDTKLGDWQITVSQDQKSDWAVGVQTYTVIAGPPHHIAFVTDTRRLIAGNND